MTYLKTFVPNSRPAYVAEPLVDGDRAVEIILEPIVAWQISYASDEDNDMASATPVTIYASLPSRYAVYYSDTDMWSISEITSDKGLDSLLEYFNSRVNV